jgi:hypothetical protein
LFDPTGLLLKFPLIFPLPLCTPLPLFRGEKFEEKLFLYPLFTLLKGEGLVILLKFEFLNGVWLTAAAPGSLIVTLYVLKFGLFMANVRGMAFPLF